MMEERDSYTPGGFIFGKGRSGDLMIASRVVLRLSESRITQINGFHGLKELNQFCCAS